jgi:hypothetical protein
MGKAARTRNEVEKRAKEQFSRPSSKLNRVVVIVGFAASIATIIALLVAIWPKTEDLVRTDVRVFYASQTAPMPSPTTEVDPDDSGVALYCSKHSPQSYRVDAHMCLMGWREFSPVMDPCFDGPEGYVACAGHGAELLPVKEFRDFSFDAEYHDGLPVDQADQQIYPWKLEVDRDGIRLTCLLDWSTGNDPNFAGGMYSCMEGAARIVYALNPDGLLTGDQSETMHMLRGADGAEEFDAISLDRTSDIWTVKLVNRGEQAFQTFPVAVAWF